jgi:hypothetical protein
MPSKLIANPAGLWGGPVSSGAGNNDTLCVEAFNNSGAHLQHGDVVIWDTNQTAPNATTTTTTGSQQAAVSATSYAVASSAAFGTSGPIAVQTVSTTVVGSVQPRTLFGYITAKVDGTHITITFAKAGAAASIPAGSVVYVPPSTLSLPFAGQLAIPAQPAAALSAVTMVSAAVANNVNVAGVVCVTGDSSSSNMLVPPGAAFLLAVGGLARVNIGANTVAAGNLLGTDSTVPGVAANSTPTLGTLLGVALESQANIDANNTIRAIIKVG